MKFPLLYHIDVSHLVKSDYCLPLEEKSHSICHGRKFFFSTLCIFDLSLNRTRIAGFIGERSPSELAGPASDNLLPSNYSVRLNVGVSKQKKACCKLLKSQWYTFKCFVFVPRIPNVQNSNTLKSLLAFIWILALSEIRKFGPQTFTVVW